MFFSGRKKLEKIAALARDLVQGRTAPPLLVNDEPYRSLLEDIRTLAARLDEGSQSASEERDRILAILESMTEGVIAVDTEQRILLVNSALARAFGFERRAAQGRFFWEMFRDPDINAMIKGALSEKRAAKSEHDALLSELVFEIQVSPVVSQGEFQGVVAVFRDVTATKQFDRLRSEFVANVSHELKTPLTSILGFVETLKEGALEDREHSLKFLNIIEQQSKKLHAMIEDLLLLSRLESSKEPLRIGPVGILALSERVEQTFIPLLKEDSLSLSVEVAPKDLQVHAEAASLERALSNLVDNAVKYNRKNGTVSVTARRHPEGVAIAVRDTGAGIPAQDLGRIFERFYRADKSRSRESGGSGLGLSIAKHIVERHGGRIEVESAPGQGSTFTIILPR